MPTGHSSCRGGQHAATSAKEHALPIPDFRCHLRRFGVCESALPAAVLLAAPVRPSRSTFDAALAAFWLVCFELFVAIDCHPLSFLRYKSMELLTPNHR